MNWDTTPSSKRSPHSTFTRWEVPDPTTIENRAGVSAVAINHTLINHCHLAPRQPHTSLSTAPACSSQECWVMSDGKGHPGIRLRAMLGRKEICIMWGCGSLFTFTWVIFSCAFVQRKRWMNFVRYRRGECVSRSQCMRDVCDGEESGIIVLTCWVIRRRLCGVFKPWSSICQTLSDTLLAFIYDFSHF